MAAPTAPRLADGRRLAYEMDRPHVSAHTGERDVAARMRSRMAEMRQRIQEGNVTVTCPAANLIGITEDGVTVRCAVERSLITERESPSSIVNFCAGDPGVNSGYVQCSTWRAEKEREWHGKRLPLIPAHEGV